MLVRFLKINVYVTQPKHAGTFIPSIHTSFVLPFNNWARRLRNMLVLCVYYIFTHWHGLNRTNNPEECQILVPWSIKAKHATKMSIATSDLRYSLLWYKLHLVRLYVVFNETKNRNLENSYFRIRTYKGKHTQNHSTPLCSFRC